VTKRVSLFLAVMLLAAVITLLIMSLPALLTAAQYDDRINLFGYAGGNIVYCLDTSRRPMTGTRRDRLPCYEQTGAKYCM
jgi:hypothetical protein